ncbi:metal ABC transporter substrate-binding protein [Microbacteriaceae bacterium 4G12]
MKKWSILFSLMLVLSVFFAGCSKSTSTAVEKKDTKGTLKVYTTIFPIADFAKKIGGDYVDVQSIYPAGADAHTYEPTQKQMVDIAKGDLFVYNGAELEPFAEKMEKSLKKEKVKVLDSSQGVQLIQFAGVDDDGHKVSGHQHNEDPHIWLDPTLAMKQAENIKNALVELQPNHKEEFEKNYDALKAKFTDLDNQFKDLVQQAKTKEILVSHAAYGYWEHRYGIKQIPIAGLSSSDEPSQKQLADIAKTAKEHHLKYILFETFSTPKVAEVVQKETETKILRLNHLATITDNDVKNKKDYFSLMEDNIAILKQAMNE